MKHARSEDASSLLSVLVVVVISTILVGAVLAVTSAQNRLVAGDILEARSFYAAEAGLTAALVELDRDPSVRGSISRNHLPNSSIATATVSGHGALLRVLAEGRAGRSTTRISALVGEVPEGPFTSAIWIGDPTGGLNLAGTAQVSGPIVVGASGMTESAFRRMQFRGSHDGVVQASDSTEMPEFDDNVIGGTLEWADRMFDESRRASSSAADRAVRLDSSDFVEGRPVVVHGSARLSGPLSLPHGSTLLVSDTLYVAGRIAGDQLLFVGRSALSIAEGFEGSGQFISRGPISVGRDATLFYPCVAFTSSETSALPVFDIHPGARLDGTVIVRSAYSQPDALEDAVRIQKGSTVSGAVFSERPIHLSGSVLGSVVASSLRFYESPTVYVNWLVDASVLLDGRPTPYPAPPGFSDQPVHRVISRRTLGPEDIAR